MADTITNSTVQENEKSCPATGYQKLNVCVPVTVTPYATPGSTTTNCCGEPTVTFGTTPCAGKEGGSCSFTISQGLCVEVPVLFGATATVGKTYVDCVEASNKNLCTNCSEIKS